MVNSDEKDNFWKYSFWGTIYITIVLCHGNVMFSSWDIYSRCNLGVTFLEISTGGGVFFFISTESQNIGQED